MSEGHFSVLGDDLGGKRGRAVVCNLYPSQIDDGLLIAAAPDLLKALTELEQSASYVLRHHLKQITGTAKFADDIHRSQSAISKATGK
jgi:hypothetical protein